MDRALASGAKGRGFESLRARHSSEVYSPERSFTERSEDIVYTSGLLSSQGDNHGFELFAATLFTLLVSASNLPISYMQFLDGRGYDRGGLTGSYVTDAGISITACILLAWLLSRWRRNRKSVASVSFSPVPDDVD